MNSGVYTGTNHVNFEPCYNCQCVTMSGCCSWCDFELGVFFDCMNTTKFKSVFCRFFRMSCRLDIASILAKIKPEHPDDDADIDRKFFLDCIPYEGVVYLEERGYFTTRSRLKRLGQVIEELVYQYQAHSNPEYEDMLALSQLVHARLADLQAFENNQYDSKNAYKNENETINRLVSNSVSKSLK